MPPYVRLPPYVRVAPNLDERLTLLAQAARRCGAAHPRGARAALRRLVAAGRVQGLFLSSAIRGGPVPTMDRLLATAELVRRGGFRRCAQR
jgi:hypothetical protein